MVNWPHVYHESHFGLYITPPVLTMASETSAKGITVFYMTPPLAWAALYQQIHTTFTHAIKGATIIVYAMIDHLPWSGAVNYTLRRPGTESGFFVPIDLSEFP